MGTILRPGSPQEAGMSPTRVQQVRDLARGWVEAGVTPSLVALVARRGVIVLHEAYGVMGPEPDAGSLHKDDLFLLSSMSKPITAAAVMCLVEDGLLGLNRPVQWYLPEFLGEGKDGVMVHHLLTHTSGLADEDVNAHAERQRGKAKIPPAEPDQHPWVHEELFLRYDAPLTRPPGKEMSYCGLGYELLGEIVRRVSGKSHPDFTRERIFEPLTMADTMWTVPQATRHRIVRRAADEWGAELFTQFRSEETPWAGGGAFSTAMDMAIFAQMFLNGGTYGDARVLGRASVAAMTRNQIPGISSTYNQEFFPEAVWGLGWGLHGHKKCLATAEVLQSPRAFSHGGASGTFMWGDPDYDLVGIYFSVMSHRGMPERLRHRRQASWSYRVRERVDLMINAVMASIVD